MMLVVWVVAISPLKALLSTAGPSANINGLNTILAILNTAQL